MIDENIMLRRELIDGLEQQTDMEQRKSMAEMASLLQSNKWGESDERSYRKVMQNMDQGAMTAMGVVDQYVNTLISNKYEHEGQVNLIMKLTEEMEKVEEQLRVTPEYPTAFIELEKIVCESPPNNINLYYKLEPSKHPGAILLQINDRVTSLHQSYTVDLPDKRFKFSFYRDGISIGQWDFNSITSPQNQELNEEIVLEGRITAFIKFKYMNKKEKLSQYISNIKGEIDKHQKLQQELLLERDQLLNFKKYFFKQTQQPVARVSVLVSSLQPKVPDWSTNHVKNCYYLLQIQILSECLASFCCPIPYISILIPLYLIVKIHDITDNAKFIFGMSILCQTILVVYTILSLFLEVKVDPAQKGFVYLNCLVEVSYGIIQIGSILMMGLVIGNQEEFRTQAQELIIRKT